MRGKRLIYTHRCSLQDDKIVATHEWNQPFVTGISFQDHLLIIQDLADASAYHALICKQICLCLSESLYFTDCVHVACRYCSPQGR